MGVFRDPSMPKGPITAITASPSQRKASINRLIRILVNFIAVAE